MDSQKTPRMSHRRSSELKSIITAAATAVFMVPFQEGGLNILVLLPVGLAAGAICALTVDGLAKPLKLPSGNDRRVTLITGITIGLAMAAICAILEQTPYAPYPMYLQAFFAAAAGSLIWEIASAKTFK